MRKNKDLTNEERNEICDSIDKCTNCRFHVKEKERNKYICALYLDELEEGKIKEMFKEIEI